MKRYGKFPAEISLGPGTAYYEYDGEWPTRQVEVYGNLWLCSLKDYHPGIGGGLGDQPLSVLEPEPENEISQEEFETIWAEAVRRYQVERAVPVAA